MKFDVISCIETERGVTIEIDIDEEGKQYLISRGLHALIEDVIKKIKESDERETPEGI